MEKKDYYTLKEVILGLREEYIKNQRKLDSLRQFVGTEDKSVEDIRFWVHKNEKRNPELECLFIEKQNSLLKTLKKIQNNPELYYLTLNSTQCLKNNNDEYFIPGEKHTAYVKGDYYKQFSEQVNEIFSSDFINNIKSGAIEGETENATGILRISPALITMSLDGTAKLTKGRTSHYSGEITYYPMSDEIQVIPGTDNFTYRKLNEGLNVKFPKENFNAYQQEIIEQNESKKKSFIYKDELRENEPTTLSIDEHEKQYILRRK